MLTRFSCNSTNYGQLGFINAVLATATASAGSTPSTPTGCNSFEVIANTVAGGWTRIDPAVGAENGATSVTLCAASPKAFTDGTKKAVRFLFASGTGSNYLYTATVEPYVGRASSSNVWLDGTAQGYTGYTRYSTNVGSFSANRRLWYNNTAMNGGSQAEQAGDLMCAATSEYLYVFWGPTYENGVGYDNNGGWYTCFGVCDHTQGYNWEYAPNSLHCPWYGVDIAQKNSTAWSGTNDSYDTRNGKYTQGMVGYHRHVDFTQSGNSTLRSVNSSGDSYGGAFTNQQYSSYGYLSMWYKSYDNTGYGVSTTYHDATSDFYTPDSSMRHHFPSMRDYDNSGNPVQSINPIIVGQPSAGRPYRELKGIKQIGWATEALQGQNALPYHMTDIQSNDDTPKNYRCFLAGGKMLYAFEKV
jgi:hypothetical protein